jgi:hypothetical protein
MKQGEKLGAFGDERFPQWTECEHCSAPQAFHVRDAASDQDRWRNIRQRQRHVSTELFLLSPTYAADSLECQPHAYARRLATECNIRCQDAGRNLRSDLQLQR